MGGTIATPRWTGLCAKAVRDLTKRSDYPFSTAWHGRRKVTPAPPCPRDRLLGDMKKAAARPEERSRLEQLRSQRRHQAHGGQSRPARGRTTVETPMTTATRTKTSRAERRRRPFNKAETDAMRANSNGRRGFSAQQRAGVVVISRQIADGIRYARTGAQLRQERRGTAIGHRHTGLYQSQHARRRLCRRDRQHRCRRLRGVGDVIPMQGRAMAPQVDILDNVV